MKLKKFEFEVLRILLSGHPLLDHFNDEQKDFDASVEETGYGYYLTIKDQQIPQERRVFDKPFFVGINDAGNEMGFILFVENNELTIECHGFGDPLPINLREKNIYLRIN